MTGILVIKLGALGDFVQATLAMEAIRSAHSEERLTLLTTPAFKGLAEATGWFDEIWTDGRPRGLAAHLRLITRLRNSQFRRVYDLQTSSRSSWFFQALWPNRPEWSGVAKGCSHPHANPERASMHTVDRQAEQLAAIGLDVPRNWDGKLAPDIRGFAGVAHVDTDRFELPQRFALIVPGGSGHRPAKRWPAGSYGELSRQLTDGGLLPVLIGADAERDLVEEIVAACPGAHSLVGRTSFLDIIALGMRAELALGNDTGPMHLIAASGAPSLVLFSHESDPARCAARGRRVEIVRVPDLQDLSVAQVSEALRQLNDG